LPRKTWQNAGLINYRRGNITIQDPVALRESACECYAIIEAQFDQMFGRDWRQRTQTGGSVGVASPNAPAIRGRRAAASSLFPSQRRCDLWYRSLFTSGAVQLEIVAYKLCAGSAFGTDDCMRQPAAAKDLDQSNSGARLIGEAVLVSHEGHSNPQ